MFGFVEDFSFIQMAIYGAASFIAVYIIARVIWTAYFNAKFDFLVRFNKGVKTNGKKE